MCYYQKEKLWPPVFNAWMIITISTFAADGIGIENKSHHKTGYLLKFWFQLWFISFTKNSVILAFNKEHKTEQVGRWKYVLLEISISPWFVDFSFLVLFIPRIKINFLLTIIEEWVLSRLHSLSKVPLHSISSYFKRFCLSNHIFINISYQRYKQH